MYTWFINGTGILLPIFSTIDQFQQNKLHYTVELFTKRRQKRTDLENFRIHK